MLKFRCNHCGHRLATPRRHLGKLVVCPECGRPTHPLAEQISATKSEPPAPAEQSPAAPARDPSEILCGNCGRAIGRLEQRHHWADHLVCDPCHRTLCGNGTPVLPVQGSTVVLARTESAVPSSAREPGSVAPTAELPVVPLQWRSRPLVLLAGLCIAGSAAYGALSLLRDLAGLLAFIALLLLAGALGLLLLRVLLSTVRRRASTADSGISAGVTDPNAVLVKRR